MCLICVEFEKERMTVFEGRRALGEMGATLDDEHRAEVEDMLDEAEREQDDVDDA
ncbi:MAG: hypothetical protein ACQEVA_19355 [Myxococcota bacterium]